MLSDCPCTLANLGNDNRRKRDVTFCASPYLELPQLSTQAPLPSVCQTSSSIELVFVPGIRQICAVELDLISNSPEHIYPPVEVPQCPSRPSPHYDKLTAASNAMPIIFPAQNTLCEVFGSSSPFARPTLRAPSREHPLKNPIFSAWSAVDNVKDKAGELGNEAAREFEKASSIAQQKAGKIELYSPKYYAACTIGGILACVGLFLPYKEFVPLTPPRAQHIQL
jgi:hypothetical protein